MIPFWIISDLNGHRLSKIVANIQLIARKCFHRNITVSHYYQVTITDTIYMYNLLFPISLNVN